MWTPASKGASRFPASASLDARTGRLATRRTWDNEEQTALIRTRVDQLLVERGLAESRHKAQAMVMAGEVLIDEQKADKPGRRIPRDASIRLVRQRPPFVSRGGLKLDAAIRRFGIGIEGGVCIDIGASTGGFTDCLLRHGARRVHAIDVGAGQLHWSVRQDERVIVRERLNARYLLQEDIGEPAEFVCCDVSFISVTKILPRLPLVLREGAQAVVLAKPQFEVGKGEVGKGGIVRDPDKHRLVVEEVSRAMGDCGFRSVDWLESPVRGAAGNVEFLIYGSDWSDPFAKEAP